MSKVLEVSRGGYYSWLTDVPKKRIIANTNLDKAIINVYVANKGRYGAPRIKKELNATGIGCSKNRVARRLKKLDIKAIAKRKFRVTTDSNHNLPTANNLLNRDFYAANINKKWLTDISYVPTKEGWLYLAVVLDLYSRAVIGWAMSTKINKKLVCDALLMALWRRNFPKKVLIHSDRGSQYCSLEYQKLLKKYELICSMSRKGNCWDNAPMESFFHTLKVELVHNNIYNTRQEAQLSIFEYIEVYYNKIRRHSAVDLQAPLVFESKQLMTSKGCVC